METAQRTEPEHKEMSFSECYRNFKPKMESQHLMLSSSAGEIKMRAKMWKRSKKTINSINSDPTKTYSAEFNEFAIMTPSEKDSFRGLNVSTVFNTEERLRNKRRRRSVEKRASEVNWYPKYTTDVKDQGNCGSCWSFAGMTVYESRAAINGGTLRQYSEQEIIDCNSEGEECYGGWYTTVWDYIKNKGRIATQSKYPYNNVRGSCGSGGISSGLDMKITSYDDYGGWDEDDLANDISSGPVAIAINANDNFMDYASGIFNEGIDNSPNHAVVAVGYTSSYFYVRNSWGSDWGASGYVKLGRDVCTGITYSYYSAHITGFSAAKELEMEE